MPRRWIRIRLFFEKVSTYTRRSKHVVVSCVDAECEESLTPRDVCSSILQDHRGFINSEPFTSESYERNFDRTHEGTYEHSNVRLNRDIRNMSSITDQSLISNQNTLVAKPNETQSEDWSDGHRNHTGSKKKVKVQSYQQRRPSWWWTIKITVEENSELTELEWSN